jgi:hypothetical protein
MKYNCTPFNEVQMNFHLTAASGLVVQRIFHQGTLVRRKRRLHKGHPPLTTILPSSWYGVIIVPDVHDPVPLARGVGGPRVWGGGFSVHGFLSCGRHRYFLQPEGDIGSLTKLLSKKEGSGA